DVLRVVELRVVVELRARAPGLIVRRVVADGAPPGLVEGVAEGEPLAAGQLVVPLVAVDPQPRLERGMGQPADPAERRGGEPGTLRGPAGPAQRGLALAQHGVD